MHGESRNPGKQKKNLDSRLCGNNKATSGCTKECLGQHPSGQYVSGHRIRNCPVCSIAQIRNYRYAAFGIVMI
jgi:hypothetical protein